MKLKKILPVLILALLLVYFFLPGETGETPQTAPVQNVQTAPEPAKEDGGDLALLPAGETPRLTEGYEGFFHLTEMITPTPQHSIG